MQKCQKKKIMNQISYKQIHGTVSVSGIPVVLVVRENV
jgi:hypothetical protein